MATAHQYPEYTAANDYYGSYCNQAYGSSAPAPNGPFNFDMTSPTTYDNNNISHYQPTANWAANQYHQQSHYPTMMDSNHLQYSDQCRQPHQPHQPHTDRYLSPPYNASYEGNQHLNVNHNYADNQLKKYNEPKIAGYLQEHHKDNSMHVKADQAGQAIPTEITQIPKNELKRTRSEDKSEEFMDSPALRALLTNRKLRYSPDYITRSAPKKQRMNYPTSASIDSVALSPNKTEDSLDFFEDFPPFSKAPVTQNISNGLAQSGIEYGTTQITSPAGMTCDNLIPATSSPMTKYVEGISTPPLSPKEAEPVNQMRISDASSPDNLQWIQNGNDCKYTVMTFI